MHSLSEVLWVCKILDGALLPARNIGKNDARADNGHSTSASVRYSRADVRCNSWQ